jgi:hypothetical protein
MTFAFEVARCYEQKRDDPDCAADRIRNRGYLRGEIRRAGTWVMKRQAGVGVDDAGRSAEGPARSAGPS